MIAGQADVVGHCPATSGNLDLAPATFDVRAGMRSYQDHVRRGDTAHHSGARSHGQARSLTPMA
jgi:hypothetical protein